MAKRPKLPPISAGRVENFKKWLIAQGAEIQQPTNQYEILRFRAMGGNYEHSTGVVYQGKNGCSVNNEMVLDAYDCYRNGGKWEGKATGKRKKSPQMPKLSKQLVDRDGNECFYCGLEMPKDDMTREHLVAVNQGGPNRLENMVLSHKKCNLMAGNMAVIDKVKLREEMRRNQ